MSISTGGDIPVFIGSVPTFKMFDKAGVDVDAGYVQPTITQADIRHTIRQGENRMEEGGVIKGFSDDGEELTCTFTLRPEADTLAKAIVSARLPGLGFHFRFNGLPVIRVGSITDALNTNPTSDLAAGTVSVWWYRGGGQLTVGTGADGHGMVTIELHRYPGITATKAE